ncbi:MAG: transcriptional regulator [Ferruginibacter sp.]|nr:transcriptional regulator [Cytophagales bacterium]
MNCLVYAEPLFAVDCPRPLRLPFSIFFALAIRFFISFLLLVGWAQRLSAQNIPLGTWRTHPSYQAITTLAIAEGRVYGGSPGGLFFYDQAENSTTRLSRMDGFAQTDVSRIGYSPSQKTLLVAYQNGNLDLLRSATPGGEPDQITNVPVIRNAAIPGSKRINDVTFRENLAYLSGDFGLVVLDLIRAEVRETYRNIGTNGSSLAVYACAFANDSLFLASSQGVLAASLAENVNLQDYANWKTFTPAQGLPNANVSAVASRNGRVYAGVSGRGVYAYRNGTWAALNASSAAIQTLRVSNNQLLVSAGNRLLTVNANDEVSEVDASLALAPQEAAFDAAGKLWVADARAGLLSNHPGPWQAFIPNGPASNQTWELVGYGDRIAALAGGFDDNQQRLGRTEGLSVFDGESWQTYRIPTNSASTGVRDLVAAAYHPGNQTLYLGSFGDGLLAQKADLTFEAVPNSPLVASANGVRVTGLATDADGNLWVANAAVPVGRPSLHVLRRDNTWQSFPLNPPGANHPLGVLVDDTGFVWLRLDPRNGGGLLVFDPSDGRSRLLGTALGNGELPNANVRSLAVDQEGQLWVGTDDGVAVFVNPAGVFSGNYGAFTPVFNARRLLGDERITSLAVDGGNRKWIGTRNGLWLFGPDGTQLVENFTVENSPLPSNVIVDVAIEPATGEVFVATDRGILSYRGTATEAQPVHTDVKVFPNPVRPNFDGLVGISGLAANAFVKITDVAGRLVYETRANGGTATWNGRDYRGRRAETGVYLIFSASDDGTQTFVAKLAVIK